MILIAIIREVQYFLTCTRILCATINRHKRFFSLCATLRTVLLTGSLVERSPLVGKYKILCMYVYKYLYIINNYNTYIYNNVFYVLVVKTSILLLLTLSNALLFLGQKPKSMLTQINIIFLVLRITYYSVTR